MVAVILLLATLAGAAAQAPDVSFARAVRDDMSLLRSGRRPSSNLVSEADSLEYAAKSQHPKASLLTPDQKAKVERSAAEEAVEDAKDESIVDFNRQVAQNEFDMASRWKAAPKVPDLSASPAPRVVSAGELKTEGKEWTAFGKDVDVLKAMGATEKAATPTDIANSLLGVTHDMKAKTAKIDDTANSLVEPASWAKPAAAPAPEPVVYISPKDAAAVTSHLGAARHMPMRHHHNTWD